MIKLSQCLCPQRHCIIASLGDGDYAALQTSLKNQLRDMIRQNKLNPWCGLCGAKARDWIYETQETGFTSMEEALPLALQEQAKQVATLMHWRATGAAYDSPRRN